MSWKEDIIGDVIEKIATGKTPPTANKEYFDGDINWYTPSDIINNIALNGSSRTITQQAIEDKKAIIYEPDTLLITCIGNIGRLGLTTMKSSSNQQITGLRFKPFIYPKFAFYYFLFMQSHLAQKANNAVVPILNNAGLKEIKIKYPDLKTQQEISHVLEQADKARLQRKVANALTDQFLQSSFLSLFGDPVKNEKGWKVKRIGDMGIVKTGNTPSRPRKEFYGDYIEWIKTDNIKTDFMNPLRAEEYLSKEGLKVGRSVEKNSVLVTCIAGSPSTIGNAVLTDRKVAFNQQINSLTPSPEYDPIFVYGLFRQCKRMIQENTTKGMKRIITKSVFENIKFINPPLSLQQQFADIVTQSELLRQKQKESEQELEKLFQGLLQKYFG